jgi:hypothetical protein
MTDIANAGASSVDGTWIIQDLALYIFDCQPAVCGQIVWIKDASRRASQCGKTIIWGLEAKGPAEWTGGSILDPDNGKTYRLSATYEPDGTLHAQIFVGVPLFGKSGDSKARRRSGTDRAVLMSGKGWWLLDAAAYSGHSLRSGFLTSAAEAGASIWKLSEVSRHRSLDTLRSYVRRVDLFKEHAGASFL